MKDIQNKLRAIPAIDSLLAAAAKDACLAGYPPAVLKEAVRQAADKGRQLLRGGELEEISAAAILRQARASLRKKAAPSLKRVINATGVVLHTNLGRAPLSERAQSRVCDVMAGYSTLEYDLASGGRGTRYRHIAARVGEITGAESAIVVNNNAAAVLLVLSALGAGREIIVSRGQLVEIGGSFRVPDIIRQSGAVLVEVGTTNKTHLRDYEQAIGPETAAILKVHTSNYRIVGFTAQPEDAALTNLAHKHGLPVIEDLGSGTILPVAAGGFSEPAVSERLAAGIDIVTFSGDKLFGGAQAGFIAGKKKYIEKLASHPLLRAIRIDKLSLAAIEGTLLDYAAGTPLTDIPVLKMLTESPAQQQARVQALVAGLQQSALGCRVEQVGVKSQTGGGAFPAVDIDSLGASVKADNISAAELENRLRRLATPIIVRIQEDMIILDVRCLSDGDIGEICRAFSELTGGAIE